MRSPVRAREAGLQATLSRSSGGGTHPVSACLIPQGDEEAQRRCRPGLSPTHRPAASRAPTESAGPARTRKGTGLSRRPPQTTVRLRRERPRVGHRSAEVVDRRPGPDRNPGRPALLLRLRDDGRLVPILRPRAQSGAAAPTCHRAAEHRCPLSARRCTADPSASGGYLARRRTIARAAGPWLAAEGDALRGIRRCRRRCPLLLVRALVGTSSPTLRARSRSRSARSHSAPASCCSRPVWTSSAARQTPPSVGRRPPGWLHSLSARWSYSACSGPPTPSPAPTAGAAPWISHGHSKIAQPSVLNTRERLFLVNGGVEETALPSEGRRDLPLSLPQPQTHCRLGGSAYVAPADWRRGAGTVVVLSSEDVRLQFLR